MLTGATGFLGSHLARALVRNNHTVIILKRSYSNCSRIADIADELISYDLDQTDLAVPFSRHLALDAIIHTATAYGRSGESNAELIEANVLFPLRLLQASIQHGIGLFLNTDTFSRKALSLYATYLLGYHLSKKQFAEWGEHLASSHPMSFVTVFLEHMYGPFDQPTKFIPYVARECLGGNAELALTAGEQKRDFVYVDDVVEAYLVLLRERAALPKAYSEYQVGTGFASSIRDLVLKIHAMTGSAISLRFGAIPYREQEIMYSCANTSGLKELGWKSSVSLDDGLARMLKKEGLL